MSAVRERARRLSPLRVGIAVVLTASVLGGGAMWVRSLAADALAPRVDAWFAGYVDVTATPAYGFEAPDDDSAAQVVLSFIVADPDDACAPSWGGYYSLDEASTALDLDRRIARLEQAGGTSIVSFGGLANDELSVACTDPRALQAAYADVIDRYDLSTIDLDLEGGGLEADAVARGSAAIAALQQSRRDDDESLAVWLTLPVTPDGLSPQGTDAVAAYLSAGVDLAGVNAMTMDYGESRDGRPMIDATESALTALHNQLDVLYSAAEVSLTSKTLWSKVGATPMIGQNDVRGEVFGLDDAAALNAFALDKGLGRLSAWSLNRDATCAENYADVSVVSDQCSGVDQGGASFADELGEGVTGDLSSAAATITTPEPVETPLADNAATSPYAIWSNGAVYLAGTKIVWHRNVYEAKWWTRGDVPDDPVLQPSDTPWTLIGPVLPGERPVVLPTLPADSYPTWSGTTIYESGDRVMLGGAGYEAKWWTQGDSPEGTATDSDTSPWHPLTEAEIRAVLEKE